jgi:hypothetical protein
VLRDPLVRELRRDERLHLLHRHLEVGRLVGATGDGRERLGIAGGLASDLLVEVRRHPTAADLVQPVLRVEPGHRLAVAAGLDVERDEVARLRRAVHVGELAVPAELGGDGLVDVLVRHRDRRQLDPQARIAGHDDLRPDLDGGVERHRAVLLAGGDVDGGGGDDVDVVFLDRVREVAGDGVLQRLLASRAQTDPSLEHAAGRLARPEARQPDLVRDLAERSVDVPVELRLFHLDRQLDLVPLEGLDRALHRAASVPVDSSDPRSRCRGAGRDGVASRSDAAV